MYAYIYITNCNGGSSSSSSNISNKKAKKKIWRHTVMVNDGKCTYTHLD